MLGFELEISGHDFCACLQPLDLRKPGQKGTRPDNFAHCLGISSLCERLFADCSQSARESSWHNPARFSFSCRN